MSIGRLFIKYTIQTVHLNKNALFAHCCSRKDRVPSSFCSIKWPNLYYLSCFLLNKRKKSIRSCSPFLFLAKAFGKRTKFQSQWRPGSFFLEKCLNCQKKLLMMLMHGSFASKINEMEIWRRIELKIDKKNRGDVLFRLAANNFLLAIVFNTQSRLTATVCEALK